MIFAGILILAVAISETGARSSANPSPDPGPKPKTILAGQQLPDGVNHFIKRQKNLPSHQAKSNRNEPKPAEPLFSELLGQTMEGSAVRSRHTPGLSGESAVHHSSAAAKGRVQSLRQAPRVVKGES